MTIDGECYTVNVCVPPRIHVEALTPSAAVFGDGASKEGGLNEVIWVGL